MDFNQEIQSLLNRLQVKPGNQRNLLRSGLLFSAMVANVALGYIVTKINTLYLSVEQFGQYNLFVNIVFFIQVFFNLGLYESASRLIAIENDRNRARQIFGSLVVLSIFVGLMINISVLIFAAFADKIFTTPVSFLLLLFWPLAMSMAWHNMLQIVLRGFSYISVLSLYLLSPRLLYLAVMGVLIYSGMLTLPGSLSAYLITTLIAVIGCVILLRPSFGFIRENLHHLVDESKSFGTHLYVANIMSAFFYHLDKLIIGYFLDARQLAYYALAFTITAPLPYFSIALSTSAFKRFALQNSLHRNTLLLNTVYLAALGVLLIVLHRFIIIDLFSSEFEPAITPLILLVLAFVFNGLSVPYTMFFKAHRLGKEVRDITMISQIVFLAASLALVPWVGIAGAALATLLAYLLDYLLCLIYYHRIFIKTQKLPDRT